MHSHNDLIGGCRLMRLPILRDERGNLSFLENSKELGFLIERVFRCYNVPSGDLRGGHAYKSQHEAIMAVSGSFDVEIKTIQSTQKITLNRPDHVLLIPPRVWRTMANFSSNALSAHLSSFKYDANDYVRNWDEYTNLCS